MRHNDDNVDHTTNGYHRWLLPDQVHPSPHYDGTDRLRLVLSFDG